MRGGAGTSLSCSAVAQTKTRGPAGASRVFQAPFVSASWETPAGPPTAELRALWNWAQQGGRNRTLNFKSG